MSTKTSLGIVEIHVSTMPSRSASWTSTVPLPARKPSTKRAPSAAGVPGRQRPTDPLRDLVGVPRTGVVEQARRPAAHEAVDAAPVGELGERRRQVVVAGRVVEHRQRALQPAEALDHRRRRVVVEVPAGQLEPGDDAHDDLVDDRGQGGRVGPADVAVAQRRGQRHERVDQVGDVGWRWPPTVPSAAAAARTPSGRSASRASLDERGGVRRAGSPLPPARRPSPWPRRPTWCRSWRTRPGARTSPGPMPATTSRGTCCGCRVPPRARPSRRPAVEAVQEVGAAPPVGVRRSSSTRRRSPCGVRRAARWAASTSRASGTCGASAGTSPIASPTVSSSISVPTAVAGRQRQHRRRRIEHLGEAAARPAAERGERIGEP